MIDPVPDLAMRRAFRASSSAHRDAPTISIEQFDPFYREHFVIAWRALQRLGVSPSDCDDAAQEVFVAAHRNWQRFDDGTPRRAWLLGIVRKLAWRYRRTEQRRARRIEALAQLELVRAAPDEELARREAAELLAEFLDGLDRDKREAFVLGELEELGRSELGRALGINANTAYSRLHAARRSFIAHFSALADEGCARLLAYAEPQPPETPQRARTWAALAPTIAASGELGTPILGSSNVAALAKPAIVCGLIVATIASIAVATRTPLRPSVAVAHLHTRSPAPIRPHLAAAPSIAAMSNAASPAPPTTHPRSPARANAATAAALAPRATADSPVPADTELDLLLAAREAMVAGDDVLARARLAEHLRRWGAASTLARLRDAIVRDLSARAIDAARAGDHHGRGPTR